MHINIKVFSGIRIFIIPLVLSILGANVYAQRTAKPTLHGQHWIAITGKPLAVNAGAAMYYKGGNAVDAACAMLGGSINFVRCFKLGW